MKICLVVNTFPSSSEIFVYNKALALAANGHSVHIVCQKRNSRKDASYRAEFKSKKIKVHVLALSKTVMPVLTSLLQSPSVFFQSLSFNEKIFRENYKHNYFLHFFSKIKYDIIHFEFSGVATSYLPIMDELKGKKVVSARNVADLVKFQMDSKRKELMSALFSKVDLVHCEFLYMKEIVSPLCFYTEKIFLNPPGIDASFFKKNITKKLNEEFVVFSVGRLTYSKNYLTGLLAMKILLDQGYSFHWNILGEGYQLEELKFHVYNLTLQDNISFIEKRSKDEVKSMFEQSDMYLQLNIIDGISIELLEAMAMELPVVTSHCGGENEVIEHGVDGFIAEMYDHVSISKYIANLIDHADLRNQIGEAARTKVETKYKINTQTEIFEKQYRKLLSTSKGA